MKLTKLIEKLKEIHNLKGDLNIWLGVDGGEGYLPLDYIGVHPSFEVPLDGDMIDDEVFWTEDNITAVQGFVLDPLYQEDEKRWVKEILILGECRTEQEIEETKRNRDNYIQETNLRDWATKLSPKDEKNFIYIVEDVVRSAKNILIRDNYVTLEFNENPLLYNEHKAKLAEIYGFKISQKALTYGPET